MFESMIAPTITALVGIISTIAIMTMRRAQSTADDADGKADKIIEQFSGVG